MDRYRIAGNVTRVSVRPEDAYLQRLKDAPTDVLPGSLIETTEKNTDIPVGTRGYVVDGPLTGRYAWPVYQVTWVDPEIEEEFMDGDHVAGAFFKVIQEPVKFESVTDVEKFLEASGDASVAATVPHQKTSKHSSMGGNT